MTTIWTLFNTSSTLTSLWSWCQECLPKWISSSRNLYASTSSFKVISTLCCLKRALYGRNKSLVVGLISLVTTFSALDLNKVLKDLAIFSGRWSCLFSKGVLFLSNQILQWCDSKSRADKPKVCFYSNWGYFKITDRVLLSDVTS